MKTGTEKINLGNLFRHIQSLNVCDEEALFLEEIFHISQRVFSPDNCSNLFEIKLPIEFENLQFFASKYGFSTLKANSKSYISWQQRVASQENVYCDIAEFFRQIQRSKYSDSIEDLERFEIYSKICNIMPCLNYFYQFQHLIPITLCFCTEEKANAIALEYNLHVVSGVSGIIYLGIYDKVKKD